MRKYLIIAILMFLMVIGAFGAAIWKPENIPYTYDPNVPNYKVLGGIDMRAGESVVVDVNCYDPDGDPFTIEVLSPYPAGMTWHNGESWVLEWTPTAAQEGLWYIDVEAKDQPPDPNDALTDRGTYIFRVRPLNRPPILLPVGI